MESAVLSPAVANHILRSPGSAGIVASYLKTVLLHDWWLIKVDANSGGSQLGVGGHAARKGQAIRTFHSAAIVKRHDAVTLETADGIKVTITGFINRSRTLERGFTLEVCNHFLSGFPDYWEKYTGLHTPEESYSGSIPSGVSWKDLPVTQVRDILMSSREDSCNSALAETVLNDILHKYGVIACNQDTEKQTRDNGDRTPQNENSTELGEKSKDNHVNPETEKVGFDKTVPESEMVVEVNTYKRITRSQTVRKDREEVANVPTSGEEAVNSRLFTTPPKQDRSEAVVKIKDVGGSMCSSFTENEGVKEFIPEGKMSPDVKSKSKSRIFHKSAPPVRKSKRLRKLPDIYK